MITPPILYSPRPLLSITKQPLNTSQKDLIAFILRTLMLKIEPTKPEFLTKFEWTKEDDTEETSFLMQILFIAQKQMPPAVEDIRKTSDYILNMNVDLFFSKIGEINTKLKSWIVELNKQLTVFETTLPHHKEHEAKLLNHGQSYSALLQGDLKQIEKDKESFLLLIRTRINSFNERKSSLESLNQLVNAHDNGLNYLELNIKGFRERTDEFKAVCIKINDECKNLVNICRDFENSFCLLKYIIDNNCLCTSSNKNIFWGLYEIGYYGMPKFPAAKLLSKAPKKRSPKMFNPKELSIEQMNIVENIFYVLYQKHFTLPVTDIPPCRDFILEPLVRIAQDWTPLSNHIRKEQDSRLTYDIAHLNDLLDKTIDIFDALKKNYLAQIKSGLFVDERKKDMQSYATYSKTHLTSISSQKKELEERLNTRIGLEIKNKISSITLDIISNSHDIPRSVLDATMEYFHKETKKFKRLLKELLKKTESLNTITDNFCRAFDYFSYLYENGLKDSSLNQIYFNGWYALGYLISVQEGLFKAPPQATPPTLESAHDSTEESTTIFNVFTDVEDSPSCSAEEVVTPKNSSNEDSF